MAYTPELSQTGSATLRRLAWFRKKPMSKTLEVLLEATGRTMAEMRPGEVCGKCRDDSICDICPFKAPKRPESEEENEE
jgi:recombinational DNA repair protein RecR